MNQKGNVAQKVMLFILGVIAIWVGAAFASDLAHSNGQVSQVIGQYFVSIGLVKDMHTLVDFYTHIKGVEYLICVVLFFAFPAYYIYMKRPSAKGPARQ